MTVASVGTISSRCSVRKQALSVSDHNDSEPPAASLLLSPLLSLSGIIGRRLTLHESLLLFQAAVALNDLQRTAHPVDPHNWSHSKTILSQ